MSSKTDVVAFSALTNNELAGITSFNDALALLNARLAEVGGVIESIADYGTGFSLLKDKGELLGKPFIVLAWFFREGEYGDGGFVSAEIVTEDGRKLVINDGSTGIRDQLVGVTERRRSTGLANETVGLAVPGGLTKSDYFRHEGTGEIARAIPEGGKKGKDGWLPASTYYLA